MTILQSLSISSRVAHGIYIPGKTEIPRLFTSLRVIGILFSRKSHGHATRMK